MKNLSQPARWVPVVVLLALAAVPTFATAFDDNFLVAFFARVLIYAIAASALNIALGFGGLVSLGHALFIGVGMYSVSLPAFHGVSTGAVHLLLCVVLCAGIGAITGLISLRTSGIAFIMITLAFAQMLYYLMVSLKAFGGDDGLPLPGRASIGLGLDLSNDTHFYYVVLAVGGAVFLALHRLVNARFGHTLQAIRENETRMLALGFPVYRFKLVAFTLAGALAGLAGALLANQGGFVSPSAMQWSQSGMLMIMVILGGVGHLYGGLAGAALFLIMEEVLVAYTIHWQFGLGAVLLAVVLLAPNGLMSLGARAKQLLKFQGARS